MREELTVAHSVILFDNLNDLLAELDQSMETYSKLTTRYEDRLGILLRQAKDSADPKLRSASEEIAAQSSQLDSDQQNKKRKEEKKQKDDKKREGDEKGWIVLEAGDHVIRVANGADSQILSNEISILFKVIETLKSKITALDSSRKLISELTSQGFRSDRKLRVVFKDGLPRYLISSTDVAIQQQKKFKYAEQFRLAILK
ncbi:MAG: hypothetical protein ACREBS_02120 [Nitrososphaerales archaeon]